MGTKDAQQFSNVHRNKRPAAPRDNCAQWTHNTARLGTAKRISCSWRLLVVRSTARRANTRSQQRSRSQQGRDTITQNIDAPSSLSLLSPQVTTMSSATPPASLNQCTKSCKTLSDAGSACSGDPLQLVNTIAAITANRGSRDAMARLSPLEATCCRLKLNFTKGRLDLASTAVQPDGPMSGVSEAVTRSPS